MLGRITVGFVIALLVMLWLAAPYTEAYNKKPISKNLVLTAWILIPLYVGATGVYFLWKAGLV